MTSTLRGSLKGSTDRVVACPEILASDGEYRAEYIRFVDAMSYASDDERVDFDSALETFSEVGEWFA